MASYAYLSKVAHYAQGPLYGSAVPRYTQLTTYTPTFHIASGWTEPQGCLSALEKCERVLTNDPLTPGALSYAGLSKFVSEVHGQFKEMFKEQQEGGDGAEGGAAAGGGGSPAEVVEVTTNAEFEAACFAKVMTRFIQIDGMHFCNCAVTHHRVTMECAFDVVGVDGVLCNCVVTHHGVTMECVSDVVWIVCCATLL
jgi:hypothetical protein